MNEVMTIGFSLKSKLKRDAAIDPGLAERMRPFVKEFLRLCDRYGIGWDVAGCAYGFSDVIRQRMEGILANH